MERAANIFYDYVKDYAPELMSPTYDKFQAAAQDSVNARTINKPQISLEEKHDKISLSSLSRSLIGLSK